MNYQVFLKRSAEKELDRLPQVTAERIMKRILALEQNPRPFGIQKLSGQEGAYRIRVGDYRILYSIDDRAKRVEIISAAHRREVYR